MFEILPSPSLEAVLIFTRGALLIGAFWVFALAFKRWRHADMQQFERMNAQLNRAFVELRSLHETVTVLRGRIDQLVEQGEQESRRLPAQLVSGGRSYEVAMRLARSGLSAEELVTNCGVSRHEAELLTRLHNSRREADEQAQRDAEFAAMLKSEQPAPKRRGSRLSVVG